MSTFVVDRINFIFLLMIGFMFQSCDYYGGLYCAGSFKDESLNVIVFEKKTNKKPETGDSWFAEMPWSKHGPCEREVHWPLFHIVFFHGGLPNEPIAVFFKKNSKIIGPVVFHRFDMWWLTPNLFGGMFWVCPTKYLILLGGGGK